ncbi:MAG TPA: MMPL family transporter [Myxococcota bacterium]|nr:MMPL family transporter [Myxococcota bacterium]
MNRLLRLLAGHPWVVLGLALVLSALTLPSVYDFRRGESRLRFDGSYDHLTRDESGPLQRETRRIFGSDETVIVGLLADDVFRPEPLASVLRISQRIRALPEVHHVSSLATVPVPRADPARDGLVLDPLLVRPLTDPGELAELRRAALASPLLAGRVVSRDGRLAAVVVELANLPDRELLARDVAGHVARIAREEARGVAVEITGTQYLKSAAPALAAADLRQRLPLALFGVLAVLTFAFKTARGMLLPLVTLALAQLWTFALMGALGRPLSGATLSLPLVLMVLSLVFPVIVIAAYYDELRGAPDRPAADSMVRALRRVGLPMGLSALTTVASLLAAVVTPVSALREFAGLGLVGLLVAFVASVTVTPAMLLAFGRPSGFARGPAAAPPDRYTRIAAATGRFVVRRPRRVIVAFSILFAVSLVAALRVRSSTDVPHAFPRGDVSRTDFDALNRRLDGVGSFRVVVDGGQRDAFLAPANLRALEELETWLAAQPEIGGAVSLVDWLKTLHQAAEDGAAEAFSVPGDARLAATLFALGRGDEQNTLVDAACQRADVVVRTRAVATGDIRALAERIDARLAKLPANLHGIVTGQPIAFQQLTDSVVAAQLHSLVLGLGVAYAILSILFLSPWAGLRALAPSAVTIAACFGFLGAANAPLSLATSVAPPIALGFALNGTILYFARFSSEARRLADEEAAAGRSLIAAGRPLTFAMLALGLGFAVLALSPIGELRWLGLTTAAALGAAWLANFLLAPAVCSDMQVVTLWDTLSLDLGTNPHRAFPLLLGMTNAQCRIVAQHGTLRRVPAGQPLLRSGVEGREMFLVIDGELEASIETPKGREVLNTLRRGDLVGEVGYYTRKHSAELEVVQSARLLRLTERGLSRLERRAPRISALLYRNLSRILATRVADTTARIF